MTTNANNDGDRSKLALVTGAGQGIGEAITRKLVHDGFRVIALDKAVQGIQHLRDQLPEESLIPCGFDLAQKTDIPALVERLVQKHGPITVLVNNAGVWTGAPIMELSDETWEMVLLINLTAPFVLIRTIAPVMISAGGGAIVNISQPQRVSLERQQRRLRRIQGRRGGADPNRGGRIGQTLYPRQCRMPRRNLNTG